MHTKLRLEHRDCTSTDTNQCIAHFLLEEIALHVFECFDVFTGQRENLGGAQLPMESVPLTI